MSLLVTPCPPPPDIIPQIAYMFCVTVTPLPPRNLQRPRRNTCAASRGEAAQRLSEISCVSSMSLDDDLEAHPLREMASFTSVIMRHLDSVTVVATTAILSLSVYIHLGLVFPILYPQAEMDKKHPSKANFNWQTCNSYDNLKRALAAGDDCPCWDGLYKGSYGLHGRHAVFFNIQRETLCIFAISCLFVCLAFVALKKFFKMLLTKRLRLSAFLIILCNAHSMYYHWWVTFSYLNESWYRYWWSQWIFGLTEAAVMYVLLLRIDSRFKIQSAHAVTVISVAIFHMSQGLITQAVKNMINGYDFGSGLEHCSFRPLFLCCY